MATGDPVDPFDATVAGALAHLKRRVTSTSEPSTENVHTYVEEGTYSLTGRIWRPLDALDALTVRSDGLTDRARAERSARAVVHLYAAAMTEDAAYPENANPANTGYGQVLWERHRQLLADLLGMLGIDSDAGEPQVPAADAMVTSHPPAFSRTMLW